MSNNNANDGAQKLGMIIKPILDEHLKRANEHVSNVVMTTSQEHLLLLHNIITKMEILEKLLGEKKKSTSRTDKKPAVEMLPTPTDVVVIQPAQTAGSSKSPAKNFAINKLVYFREQFKNHADYRAKYMTEDLSKMMEADATIASKTQEAQKLIAQAAFCWNYFKLHSPNVIDEITTEYAASKLAFEAAGKPLQQVAEAHTPPAAN